MDRNTALAAISPTLATGATVAEAIVARYDARLPLQAAAGALATEAYGHPTEDLVIFVFSDGSELTLTDGQPETR